MEPMTFHFSFDRTRLTSCLLIGVSLLGGCSEQGFRGLWLENRTGVTVTVYANGSPIAGALGPGQAVPIGGFPGVSDSGDTCAVLTLTALDQQRHEVARREGKVCLDDKWVITASSPPRSPAPT
jgi:hypothetical protein